MASKPESRNDDESAFSTMEFIAEARRPLLIERHRALVEEMELSLADSFITGEADNPRLKAMLREIDAESEQARVMKTLTTMADDTHYKDSNLRDALIEELCLSRERGQIEIATLQMHVIAVYRAVRQRVGSCQGEHPSLAELRPMPVGMLSRVLNPIPAAFGSASLGEALVYTPAFAERTLATLKRIRRAEGADPVWHEANGEPALSREVEEPLQNLPETERRQARQLLINDRIRSRFYRELFLKYFNPDELDPRDIATHSTVLHWLESIESTPHLYPFMQGQKPGQKIFRLAQMQQKIIQIHEMYARVEIASQHPSYREEFKNKNTRERLAIMAKAHYPALPLTHELMLATMLCPFSGFVEWLQTRTAKQDFVLPPDPKR